VTVATIAANMHQDAGPQLWFTVSTRLSFLTTVISKCEVSHFQVNLAQGSLQNAREIPCATFQHGCMFTVQIDNRQIIFKAYHGRNELNARVSTSQSLSASSSNFGLCRENGARN